MLRLEIVSEQFTGTEKCFKQPTRTIYSWNVCHPQKAVRATFRAPSFFPKILVKGTYNANELLQTRQCSFHMRRFITRTKSITFSTCTSKSSLAPIDYTWKSHAYCVPARIAHRLPLSQEAVSQSLQHKSYQWSLDKGHLRSQHFKARSCVFNTDKAPTKERLWKTLIVSCSIDKSLHLSVKPSHSNHARNTCPLTHTSSPNSTTFL